MTQLGFFQKALANSVEILLNTEAHVISHLRWLAESKRMAIAAAAIGKDFNSDDICDYDKLAHSYLKRNTMMRVVGVMCDINCYELNGWFKSRERGMFHAMTLKVNFMRNPDEILQSKAELTADEKRYLKKMKHFYENSEYNDYYFYEMQSTNINLCNLKHHYNILLTQEWQYNFDDVLDDDFLSNGIRSKRVTIVERGGNIYEQH